MSSKLKHAGRSRPIVIRNASFGRLWISQLQSNIGTWLMVIAVPVFVFHLTGSPAGTSLAFIAEASPALFVAPFAGLLADRCDRRLVMAAADALRAASVLTMLTVTSERHIWLIYVATFAENTFAQFFDPAYGAIVPAIVGRGGDLDEANGWSTASAGVVRLAGGPLGGLLYSTLGFHALVLADCGTYAVSALMLVSLPVSRPIAAGQDGPDGRSRRSRVAADLSAGARFLLDDRVVGALTAVTTLFLFANAALTIAVVPLAVRVLHGGPRDVGLLMAALGVGYLASAYAGRRMSASGYLRLPVAACLVACDAAFAGLFNSRELPMALTSIALIGVFGGGLLMLVNIAVQRRAPDQVLGRTEAAIAAIEMLATVAGAALGGVLATAIGIVPMADLALVPVAAAAVMAWFTLPTSTEDARARAARTARGPARPGGPRQHQGGPG